MAADYKPSRSCFGFHILIVSGLLHPLLATATPPDGFHTELVANSRYRLAGKDPAQGIAVGPDGTAYIPLRYSHDGYSANYMSHSSDAGWVTKRIGSGNASSMLDPFVHFDSQQNPLFCYTRSRLHIMTLLNGDWVQIAELDPGRASWGSGISLDDSILWGYGDFSVLRYDGAFSYIPFDWTVGGYTYGPYKSALSSRDGLIAVAFDVGGEFGGEPLISIIVKYSQDAGDTWSAPNILYTWNLNEDLKMSYGLLPRMDSNGGVWCAVHFHGAAGDSIAYYDPNGVGVTAYSTPDDLISWGWDWGFGANDAPYFIINENRERILWGPPGNVSQVLVEGPQYIYGSLAFDSAGAPHFAFEVSAGVLYGWFDSPPPSAPPDASFYGNQLFSALSGDPVNTATGNFIHEETDLSIASRGMPLAFGRFYNSLDSRPSPLGPGWTHSFNIALDPAALANQVSVQWSDGRTDYWVDDGGGTFTPSVPHLFDELISSNGVWTVTRKSLDVYRFDSTGRLLSMTDKNGNATTLAYNDVSFPDLATEITDPAGRTLALDYGTNGLLESVTDFAVPPRSVLYGYTDGLLTQVTDTLNNPILYDYDGNGYLETITDQRGVTTVTNTYDTQGRVIEQLDGNSNFTTFAYDTPAPGDTTLTQPVTSNGVVHQVQTIHTHDTLHKLLLSIEDGEGYVTEYGYDEAYNRNWIADRNANTTGFAYDERGNVLATYASDDPLDPNDGGVTSVGYAHVDCPDVPTRKVDALGHVTEWTYDGSCNVLTETRWQDLAQTEFVSKTWTYNVFGQRRTEEDERGNIHEWIYDADGKLIEEIDRESNHSYYGYDELWRRIWVTDGRGAGPEDPAYTTYFAYDDADRLTQITGPPVGDVPHSITRSFDYDEIGNRTEITDGNLNTAISIYDDNSNLLRMEEPLDGDPLGRVTQYGYDELNRRVAMIDANSNGTAYRYDDIGRLMAQEDAEGNLWTYTYDAQGNTLTETDPSGVIMTYAYDALHRRTLARDELGNERRFEYDQLGRLTRRIDANNNETDFNYDALGRMTCAIDAEGGWTEYTYDANGNLLEIDDATGRVTSTRMYDGLNRLTYAEDGNGNFYEYGYDAVGNQTYVKDANLQETYLTYDAESRLILIDYPDATQVSYSYDDNGNRTDMIDPNGSSSFAYDELNRVRSSTDSFGQQVQYSYDPVGNRIGVTYPDTKQVTYGYDLANRLETITDWDTRTTQYAYDGLRIDTVTYPNAVIETRGYDDAGRLTSIATDSGTTGLLSFNWVRDGEGNPTSATEAGTLQPTLQQLVTEYNYDADSRLTSSSAGTYQHDGNGNLLAQTVNGTATTFTYDAEDRLTSQATSDSTVQHVYDGMGNRIARDDNGTETRYALDLGRGMSHVLCEADTNGVITAYYIHGPQLVGRIAADGTQRYYHTNDIGNVVALTDSNGLVTDRYGYAPFGLLLNQEGTTPNPFTYVGGLGVMAEADGLYFMRARFYDPGTGRFLGKDPVEGALTDPQSLHRYVYGRNAPASHVDPNGREFLIATAIVAEIYEVIAGFGNAYKAVISVENTGHFYQDWRPVLQAAVEATVVPYIGGYINGIWDELEGVTPDASEIWLPTSDTLGRAHGIMAVQSHRRALQFWRYNVPAIWETNIQYYTNLIKNIRGDNQ
jgi:RHS repeat-associated protein